MVAENIQICGVQVSGKRICKSEKMKVDVMTKPKLPRQRQITHSPS